MSMEHNRTYTSVITLSKLSDIIIYQLIYNDAGRYLQHTFGKVRPVPAMLGGFNVSLNEGRLRHKQSIHCLSRGWTACPSDQVLPYRVSCLPKKCILKFVARTRGKSLRIFQKRLHLIFWLYNKNWAYLFHSVVVPPRGTNHTMAHDLDNYFDVVLELTKEAGEVRR